MSQEPVPQGDAPDAGGYVPNPEDRAIIERARKTIAEADSRPLVSDNMQRRIESELGLDTSAEDRDAAG